MKYDFTSIIDRCGKDAFAIDALGEWPGFAPDKPKDGFDVIPMWIADMNFATVPSIQKAIVERVSHPLFGYFEATDEYYESIIEWQKVRNNVTNLKKEHIGYENGVLAALVSAINAFASPGDSILLHNPTYTGFIHSIEDSGYKIVYSSLKQDENGVWRMDYEDMDIKLKKNNIHVAVFCNPHNPTGRVWEKEEIEKAIEVYRKNHCIVISDEIWSDLTLNGKQHIPVQSVNEDARNRTVALYAPSKTFNLSGMIGSYHIIYNDYIRDRVLAASSKSHYNSMNVLSMHALIGAYKKEGQEWVDELRQVLAKNMEYACDYITKNFDGISVKMPEGTYMLFLDCTDWCDRHGKTVDDLLKSGWDVGVAWQDGRQFHAKNAIRVNLALPYSRVVEAFDRLDKYVINEK